MEQYKYIGVELTPNIFAELLIKQFDGKQFKRATAIDVLTKYHKANGGILEKNDYISVFKRACQNLSQNGMDNIGYSVWRLNYMVPEIIEVCKQETEREGIKAEKVIGDGNDSVYVYYYDVYKQNAEREGKKVWECKIGRTEKDPLQRVLGQAGTCYPEFPHIALFIKCQNSSYLEVALHSILKLRGRWINSAPGAEWFMTSPAEVESIYEFVINGEIVSEIF